MMKMILAGLAGAIAGYAWYRLVGCVTGTCPITSNPYSSAGYGALMGLMLTASLFSRPAEGFQVVPPKEAARLAERPETVVLDVRQPEEHARQRLERSVLIPLDELGARLSELPADKKTPLLVYCATGRRSRTAGRLLAAQGYTGVHDLKGGIAAWRAEGRPVIEGARPAGGGS